MRKNKKLLTSMVAATLLFGTLLAGCGTTTSSGSSNPAPAKNDFKILEASIQDLQKGLADGKVTSEDLVKFYLDRIDKYDQKGPKLNSVITINPKALEEAKALDQERKTKGPRGPLHGIPIVLKDNFDTFDMPTSGGNKEMAKSQPSKDAFLTKKLRDAGAIIIAKTNLHELARAGWTNSTLLGQTLNPYDLTRTPGGSSGGTGTAVAANFAVAGMGSDTVNSVRSPASANNLVGFRPTYGLFSRTGIIPAAMTQDMAGQITRSVADAAIMMNVLAGVDPADAVTAAAQGHIEKDYTAFLKKDGLKGKRLGVVKAIVGKDPDVTKAFNKAVEDMKAQGAEIVYIEDPNFDTGKISKECDVQLWESTPNLDEYFKTLGPNAPIKSTKDLLATGTVEKGILKLMTDSTNLMPNNLTNPDYKKALDNGAALRTLVKKTFEENKLDAFIYPHQQVLVSKVVDGKQPGRNGILASIAQTPAITVPGGFSTPSTDAELGVPIGVEFMGLQWSEPKLIEMAYSYEQATKHRQLPKVTP
jgi:amidase